MQLSGHVGMALLLVSPVWFALVTRESVAVALVATTTAMLPDLDLVLEQFLPIEHHGITHSFLFVVPVCLVLAAVATWLYETYGWKYVDRENRPAPRTAFWVAFGAFFIGGAAHLVGDALTSPDVAPPIKPLYPLTDFSMSVDWFWVYNPVMNRSILVLAVLVHLALWRYQPDGESVAGQGS